MQKSGEVCKSCKPRWDAQKKRGLKLENLDGITMEHNKPVPACPYCDGDILRISKLGNHDDDLDWEY